MVCESKTKSFKLCRCSCRWKCKCLVPRVKKPHPPFNVGVPIDVKKGIHPLLTMNFSAAPPPGTYDLPQIFSKSPVTSWKREEEIQEFAATMGGRLSDKYVVQRELMKRGRGPGNYEVTRWPESVLTGGSICGELRQDIGFGVVPRFKGSGSRGTPGPGYTGREHNPYYYVESNKNKARSSVPTFEFDGFVPRFKRSNRSWSIACNRYNARHPNCLDNILKKVTSRRGPYDLFTGPRDASTLHSYQARPKSTDTKNWPLKFPSEFDRAFNGSNSYKGVWTDCPRFTKKPTVRSMLEDISLCYKDPDSPGPSDYDPVSSSKSCAKMLHPFNTSVKNVRPLRPWEIRPGPATYKLIPQRKEITGNGWSWVFKSKAQRRICAKPDQYNSF